MKVFDHKFLGKMCQMCNEIV